MSNAIISKILGVHQTTIASWVLKKKKMTFNSVYKINQYMENFVVLPKFYKALKAQFQIIEKFISDRDFGHQLLDLFTKYIKIPYKKGYFTGMTWISKLLGKSESYIKNWNRYSKFRGGSCEKN